MSMLRLSCSKIVGQGRNLLSHTFAEKAFCSDAKNQLTQILESEIAAKKEKILNNPIPPEFPFAVKDDLRRKVTMSRDFNGERISVVVDGWLRHDVIIRKQDGRTLHLRSSANRSGPNTFEWINFQDDILGLDLEMEDPEDRNLQDGLNKYLAARGFNKDYYAQLREYMINHKRKLQLHALQKIRNFVTQDY